MLYQRSMEIERRLERVLRLVKSGQHSTPTLAEELGVSIPTVSRDVTALRERGHDIRAERQSDGTWKFGLAPRTNQSRSTAKAHSEARP
jgi:biotin operon repressor